MQKYKLVNVVTDVIETYIEGESREHALLVHLARGSHPGVVLPMQSCTRTVKSDLIDCTSAEWDAVAASKKSVAETGSYTNATISINEKVGIVTPTAG